MQRAFTLIELLIVVAIIAVLAAIAVPNYLDAQTRAKVARVRADMKSIVTAVEAYAVDYHHYPPHRTPDGTAELPYPRLTTLTTPVSYLISLPDLDPFTVPGDDGQTPARTTSYSWTNFASYLPANPTHALVPFKEDHAWLLRSRGPDTLFELDAVRNQFFRRLSNPDPPAEADWLVFCYDPTNGAVSRGELFRTHAATESSP